ncbi:hypothetical protein BGX28_009348 [Mortierella sp. GBA30]|nr:hypothetical protein BGX28_009348 [Mortierella sp. GBA30]
MSITWKPGTALHKTPVRFYSRKTKTKIQIETAELERDIHHLESAIAEQERNMAAKRAYEESVRDYKQRSEAAHSIYKSLTSPLATPAAKATRGSNPNTLSFLPETFLQDLKLTFLDTRGAREETIKQLQNGLPSTEDLHAAAQSGEQGESTSDGITGVYHPKPMSATAAQMESEKDGDTLVFERIRDLGIDRWNQLIYVNALEGKADNAEQVMKLMEEIGVQPNMQSFDYLLDAYAYGGNLKKAQATIEMILKNDLVPSMAAYNSLLRIHARNRDITSAFQVFEALKKHHNPDVDIFTNLVKACLRSQEYDLGWKVFDQMQRSGATPVESTYSLMIHACAKTDQVERALDIFKTYPSRNLQPTDATFNSLIHACAMRPDYFATAFALLNEMQNVYGFEPDLQTYNTLLFACSKRQDLLTARRILQKVVQLDSEGVLKLDGVTITNFLWCVTEWKDMDIHLKSLKQRLRSPTGQTQLNPASHGLAPTQTTSTSVELSTHPTYFLLPERPPSNENEALAEGESVFAWFVARLEGKTLHGAGDSPVLGADQRPDALQVEQKRVHARLLNAYLAMYVRHNDIDKATEIYRTLFDRLKIQRDSWTYSTLLEGCYHWKNVDLGAEAFRDWRNWRKSTGMLTQRRTRNSDYQCYRRMINLLARTNHLDEAIALLEELSIAATPKNTRLLSDIASTSESSTPATASTVACSTSPASPASPASISALSSSASLSSSSSLSSLSRAKESAVSLSFLKPAGDDVLLPIYPKLKDFPVVYTKTWELEDEGARKILLRLCNGKIDSLYPSTASFKNDDKEEEQIDSVLPDYQDKRRARYQKSLRNTAIKWKGEHPQERGFFVGSQRIRELERDVSKRGQDQRRQR